MEKDTGEVKARLVEVGGRATQDLGLGRIVGQILACVYLSEGDCSLDDLAGELELSKAAVSIAARQLEGLGLLERVWKKGDRRNYYRTVEHLGLALQQGLLSTVRARIETVSLELRRAEESLKRGSRSKSAHGKRFMYQRVKRAGDLCRMAERLLGSRIVRMLTG